jgi:HlyD family secretion protein
MKRRLLISLIILAVVVPVSGYYLYSTGNLSLFAATSDQIVVSGFIESDQVNVTAEVGGRIEAIAADEGGPVTAGEPIVRLDPALLNAQLTQAQDAVDTAQAQLTQIRNGPSPSEVSAAQAAVLAAQQNYDKVKTGPTQDQLAQLKAAVDNAKAVLDQAQAAYDRVGGASNPFIGMSKESAALQQATSSYTAAAAAIDEARSHPTTSELAAAQSQVLQAQAALDRLAPTADAIAVAQAQVRQAQDALAVLQVQASRLTIASPLNGVVAQRVAHVGEIAEPGASLLTVTQLDPVRLTIYVPEVRLGQIKLGDEIGIQVDSFPGRVFKGKVIFIASQAEFTPRNVETKDQRVNTVFAVKLQIVNPDSALKPGMPADATLP